MVADIDVLVDMPHDVERLLDASRREDYNFVERLVADWNDGSNRFDGASELLLSVRVDGKLVAVGGLNRDPYLDDPTVGRIRHVYVHPDARGQGIGRELVSVLVDRARLLFRCVRVRAGPPGAAAFYESLGFATSSESDTTHQLAL